MSVVAVFDVGKTNVKLTIADRVGRLLETMSTGNAVLPGPPYRHHDLGAIESWMLDGLTSLGSRHDIAAIVPCAHGSGGVLVGEHEPAMPMIDYEQTPPAAIEAEYRRIGGSFRERGSQFMLGAAHLARQMLWLETDWPAAFLDARYYLATPQYWAWRLSGVAAGEVTSLAAQSHLWSPADGRPAHLIAERGWQRLMPPLRPAWETLGPLRPDWVSRTGLRPDVRVVNGIHDSSANLYRYQAAGLSDMTVVSTGTWMVAISDSPDSDGVTERPGVCCNADVEGKPLAGVLTMAGREFSAVSEAGTRGPASRDDLERLIASGTMALPTFGQDDALFPGTAGRGVVEGALASDLTLRHSLAVLYVALLTDMCLEGLAIGDNLVLDGSYVRDPAYAGLLAALRPQARVLVNHEQYGTGSGAALLAWHETRDHAAPLALDRPDPLRVSGLDQYRTQWRARASNRRNP
ncbi:FGGY-family carbohydrate kinase [Lichenihabitans psoromatis]|uniref:FGGY-family carbohydrate kinase n=1 Tax=Lichenihabitans psoromatis TaxID=2528642 RepID=UPI00103648CF|nr:FGGY family carbohydrate kinase [Lichenihabitans psoromatis]